MKTLLLFGLLTQNENVIYGVDNRVDVYASTNSALVEASRATAAMVPNIYLHAMGATTLLRGISLRERGICPSERFSEQSTAAMCSGFLISEKVLVTAGHCIKSEADCKINRWVFDNKVETAEQTRVSVPTSSVYSCKKIISRAFEPGDGLDYAVIELNRAVSDRRPLSYRRSGTIDVQTPVAVIGHPSGLPTKISEGARVRSVNEKYFVANLDTFGGNSGSAVLNTSTGEVEGILVRGETDYIMDPAQSCKVANLCADDGCRGEDVNLITTLHLP